MYVLSYQISKTLLNPFYFSATVYCKFSIFNISKSPPRLSRNCAVFVENLKMNTFSFITKIKSNLFDDTNFLKLIFS